MLLQIYVNNNQEHSFCGRKIWEKMANEISRQTAKKPSDNFIHLNLNMNKQKKITNEKKDKGKKIN